MIDNEELPIVYNVNFGHATSRCTLQYGTIGSKLLVKMLLLKNAKLLGSNFVNFHKVGAYGTGGMPFAVTLPKAPTALNADLMTVEEVYTKLQEGYDDLQAGKVQNAV